MLVASMAAMLWAGHHTNFDGQGFSLSMTFFTLVLPGVFFATMRDRG